MVVARRTVKLHFHLIAQIITALADIFIHGRYADKVIERTMKAHPKWGARDRRLFAESVYDNVRWWRWHWHLAGLPDAECLQKDTYTERRFWLVWAAYWIHQTGEVPPFVECHGVTVESVRQQLEKDVAPALRYSVPDWMYEHGLQEFGSEWSSILEALNEPADVFLRANTLKHSVEELQQALATEGIESSRVNGVADALKLSQRRNIFTSPLFREGWFEVQDASSQLVSPFLEVEPGMRIIDACAGAGGKTLHLAALMKNKGRIIAMDVHQRKLDELSRRARRNGVGNMETRLIESTKTIKRLSRTADRVLLDVPCSGMGVLRRNPDAKWKLSLEELSRLQTLQGEILRSHSRMVKPGGKLVYATCSVLPGENEKQVQSFLAEHADEWSLEDQMHLRPDREGFDGFYAARLVRSEALAVEKGTDEERSGE